MIVGDRVNNMLYSCVEFLANFQSHQVLSAVSTYVGDALKHIS